MSGSHFGSGYFPDDYFGLYFQPDSGGAIIGALSGSFSGSASFTGTLNQTDNEAHYIRVGGGVGRSNLTKRRKSNAEEDEETLRIIREAYQELREELPTQEIAQEVREIVAPFVTHEVSAAPLPPIMTIDWRALHRAGIEQEIQHAIAAAREEIEREDEELLLFAA